MQKPYLLREAISAPRLPIDDTDQTTQAGLMVTKSLAIVMRRTGPPDVLVIEQIAQARLAAGEVRLRALASAINHSDLEIRVGTWRIRKETPFPYVPGLEVVGEVVEVARDVIDFAVGDRAWTTMQGLGGVRAERDGGYAEYVTVAADVLAPLPADVDAVKFAAIDVSFDAWGLIDRRILTGYSTEDLDGTALRAATRELLALRLPAPRTTVLPLTEAARGHALLEQRSVRGRVVLVP